MIDLRSDTVTKPTEAMRQAMAHAEVGDDVYGDDPTVNALEARTAELLGKEAAVFVPTGSMSNQLALRAQTEPGDLIVIDGASHVILNEGGAAAALCGVTMKPVPGHHGVFGGAEVEAAMEPAHPFNPGHLNPKRRLLFIENTHNAGGGTVWPLPAILYACEVARRHGLVTHLDGARLWHASAASGVPVVDYAAPFDTVNVCFSKGLGAPVGSALAGSAGVIQRARRFRQQFGGGMRQAGIIAAGALFALDHHMGDLGADVRNARVLAEGIASTEGLDVALERVQSNIVRFQVTAVGAGVFASACHTAGLHMLPSGAHGMRAVTHRDVSGDDIRRALEIMASVLTVLRDGGALAEA